MAGFGGFMPGSLAGRRGRNRNPQLPIYEKVRNPRKERFSDENSDYSADDSDSYISSATNSPPSSRSASGSTPMLGHRRPPTVRQRVRRIYPYRLPNRFGRYLAFVLVGSMVVMAITLVRASLLENERISGSQVSRTSQGPPLWEKFQLLTRYYGGMRTVAPRWENRPEYPVGDENIPADQRNISAHAKVLGQRPVSKPFSTDYSTSIFKATTETPEECFLDAENTIRIPSIRYYDGRPFAFPDHVVGSYETLNLPEDICLDRFGRYGPYGMGYSARSGGIGGGDSGDVEGADEVWRDSPAVDYRKVDWADAQRRCFTRNSARFAPIPTRTPEPHGFYVEEVESVHDADRPGEEPPQEVAHTPRTAVVLRCWDDYEWGAEDSLFVRALISELSLASGGRYDVHILVHVKDDGRNPVWAEPEVYERLIQKRVPTEFRGLVTLWSTTQMLAMYQGIFDLYPKGPELPVHGAYRGLQMALQHFATKHPEYEHFWHWEMDIRYTGHYLDFFAKTENWARRQPRKGLWERSARFYVPSVHGSWEEFKQLVKIQAEKGAPDADNVWKGMPGKKDSEPLGAMPREKIVWGPERPADEADWFETDKDPKPPKAYDSDRFEWGVGEEADLISLNPIFDPDGTTWGLSDDITGYNTTGGLPPRRAHISTASRLSRRLLMTMHREAVFKKHFAFTEMWPATVALQHGYKAVYAPHPSFVEREWPTKYFAQVLNGGRNGASGGAKLSVFGEREHNLHGLSWFYRSTFAEELYRAWLGLRNRHGAGSEDFETKVDDAKSGGHVGTMRGGEGRMCLPPMLIHPVKDAFIPVEAPPVEVMLENEGAVEFDPGS
jgi:hypothetical protein